MRNHPLILPLDLDPEFIPCRLGDVLTDEQYARAFPGMDNGLKMLAERFFADPAIQAQLASPASPASPPAAVSSADVGTGAREGAA